jgi:predicted signal transduction protein with EAL and GGDEF domain
MAIVTTIVTLSHSLNLRVVAEGVETEAQARLLALLKCDEAQGYFFGRPMPAAEIEAWLRSHGRPAAPPAADAAGETKGAAPRASKRRAGTAQPRSRRPRK